MKYSSLLFSLLIAFITASTAMAQTSGYIGVKGALASIDSPAYDDAINIGVTVGAKFIEKGNHSVALEGEFTTTVIEGDINGSSSDWDIDTLGIYAALRVGGDIFFKARAGIADREISGSNSDTDLSYGFGIGLPLKSGRTLEIEYTLISDDANTDVSMISVGYFF